MYCRLGGKKNPKKTSILIQAGTAERDHPAPPSIWSQCSGLQLWETAEAENSFHAGAAAGTADCTRLLYLLQVRGMCDSPFREVKYISKNNLHIHFEVGGKQNIDNNTSAVADMSKS